MKDILFFMKEPFEMRTTSVQNKPGTPNHIQFN